MTTIIRYTALLFITIILSSCYSDEPESPAKMPLVIEGWIENGEAPIVMVTHAVDLTKPSASFDGFVEKWSRVSIFDGDKQYILTGRIDKNYTPDFIFTSSKLKGEVGHTYRLLVETETDTAEAVATILPPPALRPLTVKPAPGCDTLYTICATIDGAADENGYYKFFARSDKTESRFYASYLGTFTGAEYNRAGEWQISRGVHSTYSDDDFEHFYHSGDRVTVKLCALQTSVYDFWSTYDKSVGISNNLFFSFATNCPSNIRGGLGYWAAYGHTRRTVRIP